MLCAGTSPTECETDFPHIVSCMADGRDHLPCCLGQAIPRACSDLCRGEYTLQTDNIKSLFSCSAYTAPTLACIAVGVGRTSTTSLLLDRTSWEVSAMTSSWTNGPCPRHVLTDFYS